MERLENMLLEKTPPSCHSEQGGSEDTDTAGNTASRSSLEYQPVMADRSLELPAVVYLTEKQKRYVRAKRSVDFLISAIGLVLLVIPFGIIALIQKILYPHEPVFFFQERVGLGGKNFQIAKFRTMRSDAPQEMATSQFENPDEYITPLGSFLRRFSIDELPQLVNVLNGDMAIIGPRPLIPSEQPIQALRACSGVYSVRPGITGLAQINGRDRLDDYTKFLFDLEYVQNLSYKQDILIFIKSFSYILRQKDIGKTDAESKPILCDCEEHQPR